MKSYKECCSEVAHKHFGGKNLVIGHRPVFYEEAAELYASQFKNGTLESLFEEHKKFAQEIFPESTWQSSLEGLKREIKEVEDSPLTSDFMALEYIDCLMYLLDSYSRAGCNLSKLRIYFSRMQQNPK